MIRRAPIKEWLPEIPEFWERKGKRVAWRNLGFSIFAENMGFTVWLLWSVMVVQMTASAGFHVTTEQKFWLVAVPNLVGAFLRIPYTVAVAKLGGRLWTVISAALLIIPVSLLWYCVTHPGLPFWVMLACAATAGFGGGNFASSMSNISYFFPENRKGLALGLNAAGGNLGVAMVQLLVPVVIGFGIIGASQAPNVFLQNAALLWLPLIVLAMIFSALFMDSLEVAKTSVRKLMEPIGNRHTWVMCVLYIGTFGSFIGYSAAFGLLLKTQYPAVTVAHFAFLGPLVGSLSRPLGGMLADRLGGARVTAWVFTLMGGAVLWLMTIGGSNNFGMFLAAFLVLFAVSGVGNGSTYRMIPAIFRAEAMRTATDPASGAASARRQAAAVIGLAGAVGAVGGFFIPLGFASSLSSTGSINAALGAFVGFYAICLGGTWWFYLRQRLLIRLAPSLAPAAV